MADDEDREEASGGGGGGSGRSADVLKVLIASDNHLGYLERDAVRGNDSFTTFEEILQIATERQVDFVLLGGDLFHDNKPSRNTLYKTMELLRRYCLGPRPVQFEIVSDQSLNFPARGCVNYEDPNLNVQLPIFSIHGNHDDPAGDGGLAALDVLSVSGLVNYFGKSDAIDDITLYPILLRKGATKVSMYGLGNIRDERLYRTFFQKKVKLMRPKEFQNEWFSVFVLHQNRAAHSPKNHIHECMLDGFLDFVVWGHEHECLIKAQADAQEQFYISQPGSSVATSLSEGEAKRKHVGILEVCNQEFRLLPVPLQTVRPFVMDELVLSAQEQLEPTDQAAIVECIAAKIEEMIEQARNDFPRGNLKMPTLPLIRLKIEYTGYDTINPQRFGQRFVGRVANPNDVLLFYKARKAASGKDGAGKAAQRQLQHDLRDALRPEPLEAVRIEDLIASYLDTSAKYLEILPDGELHGALRFFVDKDDKSAISDFVQRTLQETQRFLKARGGGHGSSAEPGQQQQQQQQQLDQPDAIHEIVRARTVERREQQQQQQKQPGSRRTADSSGQPLKTDADAAAADSDNEVLAAAGRSAAAASSSSVAKKKAAASATKAGSPASKGTTATGSSRRGGASRVISDDDDAEYTGPPPADAAADGEPLAADADADEDEPITFLGASSSSKPASKSAASTRGAKAAATGRGRGSRGRGAGAAAAKVAVPKKPPAGAKRAFAALELDDDEPQQQQAGLKRDADASLSQQLQQPPPATQKRRITSLADVLAEPIAKRRQTFAPASDEEDDGSSAKTTFKKKT